MAITQQIRKESTGQAMDLQMVALVIRDEAVERARGKISPLNRDLELAALLQRSDFVDYFKYALATGVAEALAVNDANVQEVYICDPGMNADTGTGADVPLDGGLYLIVRVDTVSAALESFIAALDSALLDGLKGLPSPLFATREFVLDANLVTEDDIRNGTGYARMLSSMHAPPLKVWAR
jgi:hypothetical protein